MENPPFAGFPDADDGLGDPITMADQEMDLSLDQLLRSGKTLWRRRRGNPLPLRRANPCLIAAAETRLTRTTPDKHRDYSSIITK
jgi:hypothetical protein